jgi:hypothetical protein
MIEVFAEDQYAIVSGKVSLLELEDALPEGLQYRAPRLPVSLEAWLLSGGVGLLNAPPVRKDVLGLTYVGAHGQVAVGGRVVKNVAGYDAVRLLVGSDSSLSGACAPVWQFRGSRCRAPTTPPSMCCKIWGQPMPWHTNTTMSGTCVPSSGGLHPIGVWRWQATSPQTSSYTMRLGFSRGSHKPCLTSRLESWRRCDLFLPNKACRDGEGGFVLPIRVNAHCIRGWTEQGKLLERG